jgi:hypothetical protein
MLLSLVAILVTPVTPLQCINENCTKTEVSPIFGPLLSFFGPVEFDPERDAAPADDVIDPVEPPTNETNTPGGIFSFHIITRVFTFGDPSQESEDQQKGDLGQPMDDFSPPFDFGRPLLQRMLDDILENVGSLDLSGREMTGMWPPAKGTLAIMIKLTFIRKKEV